MRKAGYNVHRLVELIIPTRRTHSTIPFREPQSVIIVASLTAKAIANRHRADIFVDKHFKREFLACGEEQARTHTHKDTKSISLKSCQRHPGYDRRRSGSKLYG